MKQRVPCRGNNVFHVHETTCDMYRKRLVVCRGNNL